MASDLTSEPWQPIRRPPNPPIGADFAEQMRFTPEEYDRAAAWFQMVWERHIASQRPGAPTLGRSDRDLVLRTSAGDAEKLLAEATEEHLVPCLSIANDELVEAEAIVEDLERWTGREVEAAGRRWKLGEADAKVQQLNHQIDADAAAGHHHHERAPRFLARLSNVLMLLDFLAIFAIFLDLFNVDLGDLGSSYREAAAALVPPVVLLGVQWVLAKKTGERWNRYREEKVGHNAKASRTRRELLLLAVGTSLMALVLTGFLLVRLYSIGADLELSSLYRTVLCGVGLAVGIGAPLVKVLVVADDGSSESRLRDALVEKLGDERAEALAALHTAQELLDAVKRHHDDYYGSERPRVLYVAHEPLVEAENALGLLAAMLGPDTDESWAARRVGPPTAPPLAGGPTDLPLLSWSWDDVTAIDNQPLTSRDARCAEQSMRATQLRLRLSSRWSPAGEPQPAGVRALTADPRPPEDEPEILED